MTPATMKAQHENEFESVSRKMNKWVNKVLGVNYHKFCPAEAWTPSINLYEDDVQYLIVADLAGVKGEEIDLNVDEKGMLVLVGNRDMPDIPSPIGSVRLHLMEIDHGHFCRTLDLPEDANVDKIEATYKCGFLWIRVPKK